MMSRIECRRMRVGLLISLALLLSMGVAAQKSDHGVSALANSKSLKNGRLSVHAVNAATGETVVSHRPDAWMTPASTLKLLTTYAAVDLLGPDHRFQTQIGYQGELLDGRLEGDIVVRAGGDPTLGSLIFGDKMGGEASVYERIIDAMRPLNIHTVTGRIVVDQSHYSGHDIASGYAWDDIDNYYAAPATALTIRDNRYSVFLKSSGTVGQRCTISRIEPDIGIEIDCRVEAAAISSDQAYFYQPGDRPIIQGRIPLNKTDFEVKGALRDPAAYFIKKMAEYMASAGIRLEWAEPLVGAQSMPLLTIDSPKLIEITRHTNMRSDNLYADHLLRQIGILDGGDGSFDAGIDRLKRWMIESGLPTSGLKMKDGSGLCPADRVTTRMLCMAMSQLRQEDYYRSWSGGDGFMQGLPVAGESGSMRRVGKGTAIAGKMRAKTGYIDGVRAYTGAVVNGQGEVIVFSVIANDYDCSASEMRKMLAGLLLDIGR